MTELRFSIPEILSFIGLSQCLYVIVYMMLRAGDHKKAMLPAIYFLVLACAFGLDFFHRFLGTIVAQYDIWIMGAWFSCLPFSVLLIIQIAQISRVPPLIDYWVLALMPLACVGAYFMAQADPACGGNLWGCAVFRDWLTIAGILAGALSVVAIWSHRGLFNDLYKQNTGKDRYWLVLTLVIMNLALLGFILTGFSAGWQPDKIEFSRTIIGLAFVYLAGTSLFRIYPQAVRIKPPRPAPSSLPSKDKEIVERIKDLIKYDKIYHEAAYSRSDLARELEVPETILSKIINQYFGKSFPQLLNEYRVEDAKHLLKDTNIPIKAIAEEAGFNSTASFNRVFRDIEGVTPSIYRSKVERA